VIQLPFIFVVAFSLCFYLFGLSFLAGAFVLVVAIISNKAVGKLIRKV